MKTLTPMGTDTASNLIDGAIVQSVESPEWGRFQLQRSGDHFAARGRVFFTSELARFFALIQQGATEAELEAQRKAFRADADRIRAEIEASRCAAIDELVNA